MSLVPDNAPFSPHFLQLWFARVSNPTINAEQTIQNLLSDSEIKRLDSIKSKNKRREFLLSRALMRHALSHNFPVQEKKWLFIERPGLAPVITNLPDSIYTSLSHSHGFVCFAISSDRIGIDLENAGKQRDFVVLAEIFMNDEELDNLRLNETTQIDQFYQIWCAKEAYYKFLTPSEQSDISLKEICFSELIGNDSNCYLLEGKIEQYRFASITRNKPAKIICNYFLTTGECPGLTSRFDTK